MFNLSCNAQKTICTVFTPKSRNGILSSEIRCFSVNAILLTSYCQPFVSLSECNNAVIVHMYALCIL